MTTDPAFLALLQLADGLFPAGGFAHSFGLETYVQEGRVDDAAGPQAVVVAPPEGGGGARGAAAGAHPTPVAAPRDGEEDAAPDARPGATESGPQVRAASRPQEGRVDDAAGLEAFVVAHLEGSAGPCDAVAVAHATRIAARDDVEEAVALDARLDAMKCVPEFRAASRQMGRQTLRATSALDDDRFLAELLHAVEDGLAPGHHALAFGVALGRAGADAERAAVAYLYSTAALLVGAGLRLIALGQVQGQRLLARLRPRLARLGSEAAARKVDDLWSFNPGLELAGLRHATLDRRLFRS